MIVQFRDGPLDGQTRQMQGDPLFIRVPCTTGLPDFNYSPTPEATVEWEYIEYRRTKIAHGGVVIFQFQG